MDDDKNMTSEDCKFNIGDMGGVSAGFCVIGLIIGMFISASVLVFSPKFYRKVARCVRPKTEPGDVLVVYGTNGTRRDGPSYQYTEIDENATQAFDRTQAGTSLDTVSYVKRKGYENCQIQDSKQQKYTDMVPQDGDRTTVSYEPVSVCKAGGGEAADRNSGPKYFILEPGSNKRLPVVPVLDDSMVEEDHVYFKLEPGSGKVVQVPRTIVNVAYGSRDLNRDDDIYFALATNLEESDTAEPYAVGNVNSYVNYSLEIVENRAQKY